jgi:DNA (cytosine-5)-methyltransferase 1
MLENVPGLAKDWRFKEILKELLTLGYLYEYRILNAADYGVPQRRKRLILIASRVGEPNFASPRPSHRTVRQTIYGLQRPGKSGDPLHDIKEERSKRIVEMIRRIPKNGGSRKDAGKKYQLECHKNFDGFKDVYGRMSWDDVSPTITGGCVNPSKGRFLHPSQNRTITLREAALLQSFPATYHFSLNKGKYAAAVMIGNALPPKFIRRQAQIIYKLLEKQEGIGDK